MSSQFIETSTRMSAEDLDATTAPQSPELSVETGAVDVLALSVTYSTSDITDAEMPLSAEAAIAEDPSNALATKLSHLVDSVTRVEELSRRAREAAVGDRARYEALVASADQYLQGVEQAGAILDQARQALQHAFGQAARAAAEVLVTEAEQIHAAFTQLVAAWHEQETGFLAAHPDVDLLVAEQKALEAEARRQQTIAANARRRDALLANVDAALNEGVLPEARRALASFEREFSDDRDNINLRQNRIQQATRAEHDLVARQALLVSAQQLTAGDLEASLAALEQVSVDGLSVDVSEDVFGRWSDACSRLAQTTGAWLVRYAPTQGRGLILLKDPSRPQELQVFSSLGMGSDYPQGTVITPYLTEQERRDPVACRRALAATAILKRAREFRAAAVLPGSTWSSFALPASPAAPVHH